jgi:hypothetical protein
MERVMNHTIALFGQAERGAFQTPHLLRELPQLIDLLGNPPAASEGLFFAIQAILYRRELIYFRVNEEGFSKPDYFGGLKQLSSRERFHKIHALCLPGVGDPDILSASEKICEAHGSLLITNQKDLYDYLTSGAMP